jgi:hypothetical protein
MDVGSQVITTAPQVPLAAYADPGPPVQASGAVAPTPAPAAPASVGGVPASPVASAPSAARPAASERLPSAVQNVFTGGSAPDGVEVSIRVAHNPNQIITVFRDAKTGQVINQVPSETVVLLAEFFQQEASGALLDKDA